MQNLLTDDFEELSANPRNVQGNGFVFQLFSTDNAIADNPNISSINLQDCENILREMCCFSNFLV